MNARARFALRAVRGLHAALLVCVPRAVRHTYRAEMIETFRAASDNAARRGMAPLCRLLVREMKDLVMSRRAIAATPHIEEASDRSPMASTREPIGSSGWKQAFRSLRRRPAFTTAVVLTLGVGTGLTTVVFSLVDTVLIKPLPYPDADRLVTVYETSPSARDRTSLIAPGRLEDWHRLNRTFVAISGNYAENVTDISGAEPERLDARRVAPRFFAVFGVTPIIGRTFTPDEERHDGPGAAVISEAFWTRRFQRSAAAIGTPLSIGGQHYQVVGVLPATFTGAATDVWLPARIHPRLMQIRQARFIGGVGRLRDGVTLDMAIRDLADIQARLGQEFPATDAGWSAEITPLKESRVGGSRRGLVLVFGSVMSLWIIAIANAAGLTLVQVRKRARELAVRAALGASRARIIGTVTREGVIAGVISAGVGIILAAWLVPALRSALSTLPRINELALDWRALAFAAGSCVAAAIVFSLVPAWLSTRRTSLGAGTRVAPGAHGLQTAIVIGQVALSVVLVASAGLLVRSYYQLTRVETGFDAESTQTFHVAARWDEDRTRVGRLQLDLLQQLASLPIVQSVGMTNFLPATGATLRYQVHVEGINGPNADGSITAGARMVSPGYLRALRVPLMAGAWCPEPSIDQNAARTVMLNRRFVEVHAPDQNVVGRTLRIVQFTTEMKVAGVIGDIAEDGLDRSPEPYVYTCDPAGSWPDPEYVVRTTNAQAFERELRRVVKGLDSSRAVFGLRPVAGVLDAALQRPRFEAAVVSAFSSGAMTLAAIGLYSLFTLLVAERTREIAVRLALGASPRQMARQVIARALWMLAAGLSLGVILSAGSGRVLQRALYGLAPLDAPALLMAVASLAGVGFVAVLLPAVRAARVEPVRALRAD